MRRFCSTLLAALLPVVSMNAMANVQIILGSAPADREAFQPPQGYVKCHKISAGYHHGVWINKHRVCEYGRGQGTWISGHWQCSQVRKSICLGWDWVPGQWQNGGPRVTVSPAPLPPAVPYPVPPVAYAPAPVVRPAPPMPVPSPSPVVVGQQPMPPMPVPSPGPVVAGQQPMPPMPVYGQPPAQPM